jgi:hypothetical protein
MCRLKNRLQTPMGYLRASNSLGFEALFLANSLKGCITRGLVH